MGDGVSGKYARRNKGLTGIIRKVSVGNIEGFKNRQEWTGLIRIIVRAIRSRMAETEEFNASQFLRLLPRRSLLFSMNILPRNANL